MHRKPCVIARFHVWVWRINLFAAHPRKHRFPKKLGFGLIFILFENHGKFLALVLISITAIPPHLGRGSRKMASILVGMSSTAFVNFEYSSNEVVKSYPTHASVCVLFEGVLMESPQCWHCSKLDKKPIHQGPAALYVVDARSCHCLT